MLKVINPGLFTTVQDLGRKKFRNYGVPESGVMDTVSVRFANELLENHPNSAVLEITLMGGIFQFLKATSFVVTGADFDLELNEHPILSYNVYIAEEGDILEFGNLNCGVRAYLAVKNGFDTETVLNSKSFYKNITKNTHLLLNDTIKYQEFDDIINENEGSLKITTPFFVTDCIEVYKAPEFDLFTQKQIEQVLEQTFTVSNEYSRMGYRLQEAVIPHSHSIVTSPVIPGTVQVVPSGNLIVLMKDAQTTGGYPRLFQLTELSISILAQKQFGDTIKFKLI